MNIVKLVGSKMGLIVVGVLVVGLISFAAIQYIQGRAEDKITIEILKEQNKKRKAIKDAVKDGTPADPGDATGSLQYLRDR